MQNRVGIYKNPKGYAVLQSLIYLSVQPSTWLLPPTAMTELENLEERTPASYLASLLRSVLTLTVLGQSPFHEVQLGTEVEQETRAKARGI